MPISLRPHNVEAHKKVKEMLKESNRAAVIHPTGTGKMYIALKLLEENKDKKAIYLAPSKTILHEIKKNIFAEGMTMQDFPKLQRITYSKLARMSDEEIEKLGADIIILDEFHYCGAKEWGKGVDRLIKKKEDSKILGLSATPIRYSDGLRDMADELFGNNVASEMSLEEAIEKGILPEATYVTALYGYEEELDNMKEDIDKISDKEKKVQAQELLDTLKGKLDKDTKNLPELFSEYMQKSGKYIVFCKDEKDMKEKMQQAQEMFGKVNPNITAKAVSSKIRETDKILTEFERDKDENTLKLLFAIDMLNQGYHVPDLDGVVMMRPTSSPTIFTQQFGRALSSGGNKEPVIFDLVNNYDACKVREEFAERLNKIKKHKNEKAAETGENSKSKISIFDKTKEYRDIIKKINELTARRTLSPEESIEIADLARKYGRQEEEIKRIIINYGSIDNFYKAFRNNEIKNNKDAKLANSMIKRAIDIDGINNPGIEKLVLAMYENEVKMNKKNRIPNNAEEPIIYSSKLLMDVLNKRYENTQEYDSARGREGKVIERYFDLRGEGLSTSYDSIGQDLNVSRTRIGQILGKGLRILSNRNAKWIRFANTLDKSKNNKYLTENEKKELVELEKVLQEICLSNVDLTSEEKEKNIKSIKLIIDEVESREEKEFKQGKFPIESYGLFDTYSKGPRLRSAGIETLEELQNLTREELINITRMTESDVQRITERLEEYGMYLKGEKEEREREREKEEREKEEIEKFLQQSGDKDISILDLSNMTYNALTRNGIHTCREFLNLDVEELSKIQGFGPHRIREIKNILNNFGTYSKELAKSKEQEEITQEEKINQEEEFKQGKLPIEYYNFSARTFNVLKRAKINTLGDIQNLTWEELIKIRNLGRNSAQEIIEKLEEYGLHLKGEENEQEGTEKEQLVKHILEQQETISKQQEEIKALSNKKKEFIDG